MILCTSTFVLKYTSGVVVSTSFGDVNGTVQYSRDGRLFYGFLGLPYAKPPVGELRFKPPQDPLPWNNTYDATKTPPICSQITLEGKINGQEDCLYLNVFTPNLKPEKPLPVWVFIHGGAFRSRSADAGPTFIMDHDVIFVSFNYRLGIFGFLSTGDEVIPGNYGLKDQIAVLKWVQKNIANFGGDPGRVTLNGMSSGAICTHLLCMSPKSKGLFHRVILQSGSALSHWSHYAPFEARNLTMRTVKQFKCGEWNSENFLPCLQNVSAENLVITETISDNVFKFLPVIEKSDLEEAVLTQPPAMLNYYDKNITMMVGFTANEDDVFLSEHVKSLSKFRIFMLNQLADFFITGCIPCQFKYNSTVRREIIHMFREKYFDNRCLHIGNIGNFSDLMTDMSIVMPILDTVLTYPGKKYLYMYNFTNPVTAALLTQVPYRGAIHSDDGLTLHSYNISWNVSDSDKEFSRKHVAYWTNFVATGDPNSADDKLPTWIPVNHTSLPHLYLGNAEIAMKSAPYWARYQFWATSGISIYDSVNYVAESEPTDAESSTKEFLTPFLWLISAFKTFFTIFTSIDSEIWSWI